jgi:hypothetical protein
MALHPPARAAARRDLLAALVAGRGRLGIRLDIDAVQRRALIADGSADTLDAVLCMVQAAWAADRPNHGLPAETDAIEGWIVTTPVVSRP